MRHPVVKAVDRRFETLVQDMLGQPQLVQHGDGRRVVRGRALIDKRLVQHLQRDKGYALPIQRQGKNHRHRPGA